jgi:hypothetical protein
VHRSRRRQPEQRWPYIDLLGGRGRDGGRHGADHRHPRRQRAEGISRSHRRVRETAARGTVELSTNTPPGVPVDPGADQGSSDRHDHPRKAAVHSGNSGSGAMDRAAVPHRLTGLASTRTEHQDRQHHDGPPGRRLNPPEKDPSSRTPCHSDPSTAPPNPEPRTTGDAPQGASPDRPIEPDRQTATRPHAYQYASASSTLSTSIASSRS